MAWWRFLRRKRSVPKVVICIGIIILVLVGFQALPWPGLAPESSHSVRNRPRSLVQLRIGGQGRMASVNSTDVNLEHKKTPKGLRPVSLSLLFGGGRHTTDDVTRMPQATRVLLLFAICNY